jgi:hypothetical protein
VEYKESSEQEVNSLQEPALQLAATYILHQCGTKKPNDAFIQSKMKSNDSILHFLEIPLTAVATADATVGWMLVRVSFLSFA